MLPMLPCAVRKGTIRQWAGLGRDQSFCAVICAGVCPASLTPFSVLTCPCRDRSTGEYSGTADKIRSIRERQLPIGTRRDVDRERKAGLVFL
jgi:hypothetical protein